ncbi:MAG: relaxase/mobilization nuclease domain-containing protein [Niabella sp.]
MVGEHAQEYTQFHAILSCKGKTYSFDQLKSYALEIMDSLGYDKTPIAMYGHSDTDNLHLHIVTTRIGPDGKKIPYHFEGKRANDAVAQILNTDKRQQFTDAILLM